MKAYNKNAGFSLVEALITLTVVSGLILLIMNFATNSLVRHTLDGARADLLSEAQLALDIINNDIRLSGSADQNNRLEDEFAPDAPTDLFSWQSDTDTLILAAAAENREGAILFADPAQYISHKNNIIYFLQDRTLYKRILAAPVEGNRAASTCPADFVSSSCPADIALLNNIDSLVFRYIDGQNQEVSPTDARSVELTVHLQTRKYGQDITADYVTRMVFRND